jgi:hypothetical protein
MNRELVAEIVRRLDSCAVIGAYALAARGYVRQTADFDLLTLYPPAMQPETWSDLLSLVTIDIRTGDAFDPLLGVVRFTTIGESVDLVVGKHRWQQEVIDRAEPTRFDGFELRVPRIADLVLLKLYAGGYNDRYDIHRLLEIGPFDEVRTEVELRLHDLPTRCRTLEKKSCTSGPKKGEEKKGEERSRYLPAPLTPPPPPDSGRFALRCTGGDRRRPAATRMSRHRRGRRRGRG